jgi:phosphinothricin acetyltransferase
VKSVVDEVHVRPAFEADVPGLTDIYNHYVLTSPATFHVQAVSVEARLEWFRHYATEGPHRLLVAIVDDRVVGFSSSSRLAERQAYASSVETSIYVQADLCGRGIGTRLYAALFERLSCEPVHRAYAQVTLPNPASVALHRRFGFRPIGVQHEVGYKFGQYWSVQLLEKRMTFAH